MPTCKKCGFFEPWDPENGDTTGCCSWNISKGLSKEGDHPFDEAQDACDKFNPVSTWHCDSCNMNFLQCHSYCANGCEFEEQCDEEPIPCLRDRLCPKCDCPAQIVPAPKKNIADDRNCLNCDLLVPGKPFWCHATGKHIHDAPDKAAYCDRYVKGTSRHAKPSKKKLLLQPTKESTIMEKITQALSAANQKTLENVKTGIKQGAAVKAEKVIMEQMQRLVGDSFPEDFYATPLGEFVMDVGACYLVTMAAEVLPQVPAADAVKEYAGHAVVGVTAKATGPLLESAEQLIRSIATDANLVG